MPRFLVWVSIATAVFLSSCGGHFRREWNMVAESPSNSRTIEGKWEGTWHSMTTGHTGRLRCLVGPACTCHGDRPVKYLASWGHIFSASFTTNHRVNENGANITFHGTHKMPQWVGGTYHYDGKIVSGRWQSTYWSDTDRGTFDMYRPAN